MTQTATDVPVSSSLIRRVTYGREATLTVRFHTETVYRFFTVPRTTVEAFLAATSKGAYFNRHLRDCFPYRRIADSTGDE